MVDDLRKVVNFFCNIQPTRTKEEAFLKGYLMGLGSHLACPTPDWRLLKITKNPELWVEIEKGMREIFEKIHKDAIKEARKLLEELAEGKRLRENERT